MILVSLLPTKNLFAHKELFFFLYFLLASLGFDLLSFWLDRGLYTTVSLLVLGIVLVPCIDGMNRTVFTHILNLSHYKLLTLLNSMNCWSNILTLLPANLLYSSKILVRDQFCVFLKHPTNTPVLCFPLLQ